MNETEFRSGNWIALRKPKRLFSGKLGGVWKYYQLDAFDIYKISESGGEDVKPIPLTKEWFVKFGFEKECEYYEIELVDNICLSYDTNLPEMLVGNLDEWVTVKTPEFVHQLQNLAFSVSGKELTIK